MDEQESCYAEDSYLSTSYPFIWSTPIASGKPPCARGGHTTVLYGTDLLVFGGHYYSGDGKFEYLNDLYAFEVESLIWRKIKCRGDIPPHRYGHSSVLYGNNIIIIGGRGYNKVLYNDIYTLDLTTFIWAKVITSTSPPPPRMNHQCVIVGDKLCIFGGYNGKKSLDDLWIFNIETASWIVPLVSGVPPLSRYNHTMDITKDGKIVVIGGCHLKSGVPEYLRDVVELDIEKMEWYRPRVTGEIMIPSMGHTSVLIDNIIVIFGGWTGVQKCFLCGVIQGKGRHTGPAHQPDCILGKALLREDKCTDPATPIKLPYIRLFNTETNEWIIPDSVEKPSIIRYGHSFTKVGDYLLIFGGWDDTGSLNDISLIQVMNIKPEDQ